MNRLRFVFLIFVERQLAGSHREGEAERGIRFHSVLRIEAESAPRARARTSLASASSPEVALVFAPSYLTEGAGLLYYVSCILRVHRPHTAVYSTITVDELNMNKQIS